MKRRRTAQEIEELLESYRVSGMTRIAYCQQVGIALEPANRLGTGQIKINKSKFNWPDLLCQGGGGKRIGVRSRATHPALVRSPLTPRIFPLTSNTSNSPAILRYRPTPEHFLLNRCPYSLTKAIRATTSFAETMEFRLSKMMQYEAWFSLTSNFPTVFWPLS